METPLLHTKLYVPRPRPDLVARPRLIEQLNLGLQRAPGLTLISAPAGSGKTTLVSHWLHQNDERRMMNDESFNIHHSSLITHHSKVAWLALDAADNTPHRFWTYLIAALQTVRPELGQTAMALLQAPQSPPVEILLTPVLNQIAALSDHIILVLDDYYWIETPDIHQNLNFLLDHSPPQLHLVIITREDPPLPLARLRARAEMMELRAGDLRFTPAEIGQFFNQTIALKLSPEHITALERRTEGWAAGLQMAALSMQNIPDVTTFIETFAGDDRYIVDYLMAEVFERQPAYIQEFLWQTALLNRLTAPLCNAVSGRTDGQACLTYLEQANLFLISLDNRRQWYRYHHLFGDLLRYRLPEVLGPEEIKQQHQRAAAWYAHHGFTDEAIGHYLAAEDWARAADLIEAAGLDLIMMQGQVRQVLDWLEALPADFIRTRAMLGVCQAWALNVMGQPAEVEACIQGAEQALAASPPPQSQDIQGLIMTVRSYLTRRQGDMPRSIDYLRRASVALSPHNLRVRSSVNLNLGFNYLIMGQLNLAEQTLQAARRDGEASQTVYMTLLSMAIQANTYLAQGKLNQAIGLYQETIAYRPGHDRGRSSPPAGYAYAGLGQALYERNDLAASEQHLSQAVEFGELMADWSMIRRGLTALAWLEQMQGDSATAQSLWQRALTVVQQAGSKRVEAQLMTHQARLWLAQALASPAAEPALSAAVEWAETYRQRRPAANSYQAALAHITLAWIDLARGQAGQALADLEPVAEAAAAGGQIDNLIKILALQALAQAAQGDTDIALNTLNRAFELAAPQGYIRTFVDYGPPMQRLLRQAAARDLAADYVTTLLTVFADTSTTLSTGFGLDPIDKSKIQNPKSKIIEPLNERELSILRLMAAGLSNREIAEELYLSVNTVKWYSSQIYGKLGVKKRAEAIDRAHELGIL